MLLMAEFARSGGNASPVELQRDVGVVGAARLSPPGQRRSEHGQLVSERRVIVLDDLHTVLHDADQFQCDYQVGLVRREAANEGEFTWAVVKKAGRSADPMRSPSSAAAPADMSTSSLREGSAIRRQPG